MRYKFRITKGRKRKRKKRERELGATLRKVLVIFLVLGIKHTSNSNET